jgi:methionine--tRNA ligase beta chain
MKAVVSFAEFSKLDLRVGKVVSCERKEGSDKLLRLKVDFGEEGKRNILSGIANWYSPHQLINKQFIFIINLEPRKIMNELSEGMILAADGKKPILLKPQAKVSPGTPIR